LPLDGRAMPEKLLSGLLLPIAVRVNSALGL
jgi:hypothetical protein